MAALAHSRYWQMCEHAHSLPRAISPVCIKNSAALGEYFERARVLWCPPYASACLSCGSEGSEGMPKTRLRAKRMAAKLVITASPNLAFLSKAQPTNRNFQRLKPMQRARLASVLKAHAAAIAAEVRNTTLCAKATGLQQHWSGTRSAHAYVKRQSCCHAPAQTHLAAAHA